MRRSSQRAAEGVCARSGSMAGQWTTFGLDGDGIPLADPYCYRDGRTAEAERALHEVISPRRLRELTGVQVQKINTLYQQYADVLGGEEPGEMWLNLPEYLLHRWGGPGGC